MGAGATLCHYCEHNFPDRCPDELHERFANLSQSEENTSFHCNVCNAWVVVEQTSSTTSGTTDLGPRGETGKKTYHIELEEDTFSAVDYFVDRVLGKVKEKLADKLRPHLDKNDLAITGITEAGLHVLTRHMEQFMKHLCDERPNKDERFQRFADDFTVYAKSAIESIRRSVQQQDPAVVEVKG